MHTEAALEEIRARLERIEAAVTKTPEPRMLTIAEFAARLGVTERSVREHKKELGAVLIGNRWFISEDMLDLARKLIRCRPVLNGRYSHD